MFAMNLRGDLAKLSDSELAARLDAEWASYGDAEERALPRKVWYSRRGPLRHPWFYPVLSALGTRWPGGLFSLTFGPVFLGVGGNELRQHLALCEIKDLMDELKRRSSKIAVQ